MNQAQIAPCDTEAQVRRFWDDVFHVRFDVFYKQRLVCLFQLQDLSILPACLPFDKADFYREMSVRPNEIFDSISPKHVQFISNFYSFLLGNLDALCAIVNNAKKLLEEPSLKFFATSAVASVFGYFSCYEHLVLAVQFYSLMVQRCPKGVVFEFLKPFFCNACTFQYIEAVTADVVALANDERLRTSEKIFHVLREYEGSFVKSVLDRLNLLPRAHLLLLSVLKRGKLEDEAIFRFFLESFVWPQIVTKLRCSPFVSLIEVFDKLMEQVLSGLVRFNYEQALFSAESILEIPTAFSDFGETKIKLIVTPLDAEMLMSMAVNCITIPENVKKCACEEYLMHQPYLPLIVRVSLSQPIRTLYAGGDAVVFRQTEKPPCPCLNQSYMKRYRELENYAREHGVSLDDLIHERVAHPLYHEFKDEMDYDQSDLCKDCSLKLLQNHDAELCSNCKEILAKRQKISFMDYAVRLMNFEVAKKQEEFETLLRHKCALRQLQVWSKVVDCHFDATILAIVSEMIANFFEERTAAQAVKLSDPTVITRTAQIFDSNHVKRRYHAIWAGKLYKSILSSKQKDIKALEQGWWQSVVKCFAEMSVPDAFTSDALPTSKKQLLEKKIVIVSTLFSNISNVQFDRRYQRLIQGLILIKRLSDSVGEDSIKLMKFCINNSHNPHLITTVLLISAMFMKDIRFVSLCSKEEMVLWYQFESSVLCVLDTHRNLGELYTKVHDQIVVSLTQNK